MEVPSRLLIFGIVAKQILRAQILAHLLESLVEPAFGGIETLAAGLFRQSDERVFAARIATGTGFDGNINNAVDHDLATQRLFQRIRVRCTLYGISTVGNENQHFAAILLRQSLRTQVDSVVEGRSIAAAQRREPVVEQTDLVREWDQQAHVGSKLEKAHLVLLAQQRMHEAP